MKNLLKATIISLSVLSIVACSSTPKKQLVTTVKVGKMEKVYLVQVEKRPSIIVVLAGAAASGALGYQVGGGSGKYWAAGLSSVAGGLNS